MIQTLQYYTPFQSSLKQWWYGKNKSEVDQENNDVNLSPQVENIDRRTSVVHQLTTNNIDESNFCGNYSSSRNSGIFDEIVESNTSSSLKTFQGDKNKKRKNQQTTSMSTSAPTGYNSSYVLKNDIMEHVTSAKRNYATNEKNNKRVKRYSTGIIGSLFPSTKKKTKKRKRARTYGSISRSLLDDSFVMYSINNDSEDCCPQKNVTFTMASTLEHSLICEKCLQCHHKTSFDCSIPLVVNESTYPSGYESCNSQFSESESSVETGAECWETELDSSLLLGGKNKRKPGLLPGQYVNDRLIDECCQCVIM